MQKRVPAEATVVPLASRYELVHVGRVLAWWALVAECSTNKHRRVVSSVERDSPAAYALILDQQDQYGRRASGECGAGVS